MIADGLNILSTMGIRGADRNLGLIPLGHSYGLGNLVMPLLLRGTSMVVAESFVPKQIAQWIPQHRVTVWPSVPALFRVLSKLPGKGDLTPLRLAISAGATLPVEVARSFRDRFGISLHNFYGSSETGGICFDRTGDASLSGRGVGRPLAGVEIRIDRHGCICVRSRATAAPRGRFVLADIGCWNLEGELQLLGRAQQVANIGGKKVHPAELEAALRALPGVTDAWVTVLQIGERDCLAAAAETDRLAEEILAGLRSRLPTWKIPRRLVVCDAFPRGDRGKPLADAMRQLISSG